MKTVQEATITELKVAAFDIDQQIKQLQINYRAVMEELQKKIQEEKVPQTIEAPTPTKKEE